MRLLSRSAKRAPPVISAATPEGLENEAAVPAPSVSASLPEPASVITTHVGVVETKSGRKERRRAREGPRPRISGGGQVTARGERALMTRVPARVVSELRGGAPRFGPSQGELLCGLPRGTSSGGVLEPPPPSESVIMMCRRAARGAVPV